MSIVPVPLDSKLCKIYTAEIKTAYLWLNYKGFSSFPNFVQFLITICLVNNLNMLHTSFSWTDWLMIYIHSQDFKMFKLKIAMPYWKVRLTKSQGESRGDDSFLPVCLIGWTVHLQMFTNNDILNMQYALGIIHGLYN